MSDKSTPEAITLAIPAYNAARYIAAVLAAANGLLKRPSVVLVVDDGSSDDTGKIATSLGAKVIRHHHNRGLGAARQTALEACETPWFACIDSDVAVEPAWLSAVLAVAAQGNAAGVGGDLRESQAVSVADRWRARMMAQTHGGGQKIGVNLFGCNTLHRAQALKDVGGFNAKYTRAYEDIDISERLRAAGHTLIYTPTAVCEHLRKDTVTSVLRAAFSWRLPRYEEQRVYQDLKTMLGKWVATFKEDLRELTMLIEEGEGEISFPCLVQLFANPLQDLAVVASSAQSMTLRSSAGIGSALVLLALKQSLLPQELKQAVGLQLKPFVDEVTRILSGVALAGETEELSRLMGATVTTWSSVLAFSPEHNRRMLRSAQLAAS